MNLFFCVRDSSGNPFFEAREKRLQRIARPPESFREVTPIKFIKSLSVNRKSNDYLCALKIFTPYLEYVTII